MSWLSVWDSVWIALLGSAMLYGTYRAVEWRWPERYLGMTQTFGLSSQQTWMRFAAYRCIPTYLFAATCIVTVERVGGNGWLAAGVMWFVSVALTHGRVVLEGLIRKWGEANYAAYHLLMALLLAGIVLLAHWSAPSWAALVPPPDELLSALWSGLLVAGIGGFAVAVIRPRSERAPVYGEEYFVDRATRDVGIEALDWLFKECMRTGANPVLVKAVLVAEALQRPKWLRGIERVMVRVRLAKTSGVMQMPSREPLSDRESITEAANRFAGVWALRLTGPEEFQTWNVDLGDAWESVTTHNGDAKFAKTVRDIANYLLETVSGRWVSRSDSEPIVLELRRLPGKFILRGIASAAELSIVEINGKANYFTISAPPDQNPGTWWAWEHEVVSGVRVIAVVDRDRHTAGVARLVDGELHDVQAVKATDFQELIESVMS
ncbi:hypothetical protein ACCO44_01445 [Microbacterium maritypicum]|uniref:hypothetical protein n=1 Tax=Microbacterium maritypicum TaxID=33918 RepID=UPI0035576C9B